MSAASQPFGKGDNAVVACPKCACTDAVVLKVTVPFSRVARSAFDAHRAGRTADGLGDLVMWLGLQASNAVRKSAFRCTGCQHVF